MPYGISAPDYLQRSMQRLEEAEGVMPLIYGALELRCALERTAFDMFVLAADGDEETLLQRPGLYKPRDVFAAARDVEPELDRLIRFSHLQLRAAGIVVETAEYDIDWVIERHRTCDQYLHAQKKPEITVDNPGWVAELVGFLEETHPQLRAMLAANCGLSRSRTGAGDDMWDLYRSGQHSEDAIVRMFRLSG